MNTKEAEKLPTISVAMGTYNGSKYILGQLESIASQSYLPLELVICDDCSTDCTYEILEEFKRVATFDVRLYRNNSNIGFADNFLKAASLCIGDWISFCDQDDVWLSEKLLNCVQVIKSNNDINLVLQNSYISDFELKARSRVFPNNINSGFYGPSSQYGFWVWPGFLQTFRSSILKDMPLFDRPISYYSGHNMQPHDKWTCMIANAIGGIAVLKEPVALYRRHSETVTGDYKQQEVMERLSKSVLASSADYRFLSAAAQSSAIYLRGVADGYPDTRLQERFSIAAKEFDRIFVIQSFRADLYSEKSFIGRVSCYFRIVLNGGYIGRRVVAMGAMSALKDLAFSFGLLRQNT